MRPWALKAKTAAMDETDPKIKRDEKSAGPVVGIIVIVILVLLGGFYFWKTRTEGNAKKVNSVDPDGQTTR